MSSIFADVTYKVCKFLVYFLYSLSENQAHDNPDQRRANSDSDSVFKKFLDLHAFDPNHLPLKIKLITETFHP